VAIGWGAGDAEFADRPNVLRLIALAPVDAIQPSVGGAIGLTSVGGATDVSSAGGAIGLTSAVTDEVWQIDANLDDMSPELCGPASDAVFAAGAVDVWWAPITMKKGRPALTLSALVAEAQRDAVVAAILRETTTIGVRFAPRRRIVLARELVEVATRYGAIPVKVARDGADVRNVAPEYEACAAAARAHGVPVKQVFTAALVAYEARRQP
jgi:hypothetical protein